MKYSFGEKATEYSKKQGRQIPVIQTPKYAEARAKAIGLIESGDYDLQESDFWILMNETKTEKMMYSGLILSHNGCLKINDKLPPELKFKPECTEIREMTYAKSLIFVYSCKEQGLFEVGEVSKLNCKNPYPFAMALKRCMDRVILKNSKIAFSGIYSESESDDFSFNRADYQEQTIQSSDPQPVAPENAGGKYVCSNCRSMILKKEHEFSLKKYGRPLCRDCQRLA